VVNTESIRMDSSDDSFCGLQAKSRGRKRRR